MRRIPVLWCIYISFFFAPSLAVAFAQTLSKETLENGLTVLVSEMPTSPVVCLYALVKTGSATEGEYLGSGVSHFLEHLLFKGTQRRKVGEIAVQIQGVGGEINAATARDYTIYTIQVPPSAFDTALDILADMLMNATISSEALEKEREVVLGEMRMRNDNPDHWLADRVFRNVYMQHPYRHPIIGYQDLFVALTREDVFEYYRRHYAPNNIILSIAGQVRSVEVLPKIKEVFGVFKRQRGMGHHILVEPPQISCRHYEEEYHTALSRLVLAFSGVSLLDRDMYALDVLAMILGYKESSRLYLEVYKKQGLVHSITSTNHTPSDRGFFEIAAVLKEENVGRAIGAIWQEIRLIQHRGVTSRELAKAKRQVLSDYFFNHQKAASVAYAQALDEAFTGDAQFSRKYIGGIKSVVASDIRRVTKRYLTKSALTMTVLRPVEEKKAPEATVPLEVPAIRKHVLSNGLTVLLREDHTLPIVSLRLSMQAGTRQEPPELNGLSKMTATLWTKGTKARSADQIASAVESLGIDLDTFSGKNSLGMNIECLSEDFYQALDLAQEIAKTPTFPHEEMIKVREDMIAAVRIREDSIFQRTILALKETLFLTHPLRRDENGTQETLERIGRRDVMDFYARLAVPGNMVLSIFGDIAADDVLASVEKEFSSLSKRDIRLNYAMETLPSSPRSKEIQMDKEQAMAILGFHGADFKSQDRYGLEVLTALLGSSFSGRLFNSIREELGQAYALGGDFVPAVDGGYIYFYVLTDDSRLAQVRQLIRREIQKLQAFESPFGGLGGVTDKELADMKKYLQGNFRAGLETNSALSFTSSLDELYGLGYQHYMGYEAAIDRVTAQDIQRLARQYLDLNKAVEVTARKNTK